MKFSKKVSKLSLNFCFPGDLHHLQDHFSNFLLNFSRLAKNAKREIWRQKGDLHCKICNCIKCLALLMNFSNWAPGLKKGNHDHRTSPDHFSMWVPFLRDLVHIIVTVFLAGNNLVCPWFESTQERQRTLAKLLGGLSCETIQRYNKLPPYVMARWLPQQISPLISLVNMMGFGDKVTNCLKCCTMIGFSTFSSSRVTY